MVVRRLNSSEIVIKSIGLDDGFLYIHMCFAKDTKVPKEFHAEWFPLAEHNPNAEVCISDAMGDHSTAEYMAEIIPVPFQFRPA